MFQSKVIKKALLLDMLCKKIKDEIISEHPRSTKNNNRVEQDHSFKDGLKTI